MKHWEMIKDSSIIERLTNCFVLFLLVFIFWTQCSLPIEFSTHNFFIPFEAEWDRVMPDNTIFHVDELQSVKAGSMEPVYYRTKLPSGIKNHSYLFYRGVHSDLNFYIDRELRLAYTTRDTRSFGAYSPTAFVFVPLNESDAGKTLSFVSKAPGSFSGHIENLYYCTQLGAVRYIIKQQGFSFAFTTFFCFFSLICMIICSVYTFIYKRFLPTGCIALGLFINSLFLLSNSLFRQVIFRNISSISLITFMLAVFQLLPYLFYLDRIQNRRHKVIFSISETLILISFLVTFVLQLSTTDMYIPVSIVSAIAIFIFDLTIIITILMDQRALKLRQYLPVAISFGIFVFVFNLSCIFMRMNISTSFDFLIVFCVVASVFICMEVMKELQSAAESDKIRIKALEANATKSAFLANMSHEIRTPINSIIGMNEMILRESQNPEISKYAGIVENSSKLLLEIINDILDFSKIEAGRLQILPTEYHVTTMLSDVVHILKERAEKKNLRVNLQISPNLPTVLFGDEVRLRQIMMNLISNAVKYTERGTITFEVSPVRYGEIFDIKILVKDTGIGMKKEDIPKLFHDFTRIDEKRNAKIEGTGLGLTITKRLIDMMGGEIFVESTYGEGSTFIVTVPQKIKNKEHIGDFNEAYDRENNISKNYRELFHAPNAKILVVDDNISNQLVVQELLKRTQVRVEVASSGRECIYMCRQTKYDVIFLDDMMPDMNGTETMFMLRQDDESLCKETPMIILTANALSGARENYLESGFDDYVSKPIDSTKLESVLENYIPANKIIKDFQNEAEIEEIPNEDIEQQTENQNNRKISIQGMDYSKALKKYNGREEFLRRLFAITYTENKATITKMRQYLKEKNYEGYGIEVHAMKSAFANLFANRLSERAKQHEYAIREKNYDFVISDSESFFQEIETFLVQLKPFIK